MISEIEPHILKKFEIKKRVGKGAYGIVWKAKNRKTNEIVALKKIFDAFRNQTDAQRTFREIVFLRTFGNHPNIISLYNVIRATSDKDIYLVFEYMETDLHHVIKKGNILRDVHKQFIMYQLLKATAYLHSGNVIHRDQKPSNILLDSECIVKLCDFGLARSLKGRSEKQNSNNSKLLLPALTEYVATRWYRAPEILLSCNNYTKGVDMWSLGCILGEMLNGSPLFPGNSSLDQIQRVMAGIPKPTKEDLASLRSPFSTSILEKVKIRNRRPIDHILNGVDKMALDLMYRMLQFDPNKRITALDSLKHPYICKFYCPDEIIKMNNYVVPSLDDNVQLNVSDYRDRLYQMIAIKNATPSPNVHTINQADLLSARDHTLSKLPQLESKITKIVNQTKSAVCDTNSQFPKTNQRKLCEAEKDQPLYDCLVQEEINGNLDSQTNDTVSDESNTPTADPQTHAIDVGSFLHNATCRAQIMPFPNTNNKISSDAVNRMLTYAVNSKSLSRVQSKRNILQHHDNNLTIQKENTVFLNVKVDNNNNSGTCSSNVKVKKHNVPNESESLSVNNHNYVMMKQYYFTTSSASNHSDSTINAIAKKPFNESLKRNKSILLIEKHINGETTNVYDLPNNNTISTMKAIELPESRDQLNPETGIITKPQISEFVDENTNQTNQEIVIKDVSQNEKSTKQYCREASHLPQISNSTVKQNKELPNDSCHSNTCWNIENDGSNSSFQSNIDKVIYINRNNRMDNNTNVKRNSSLTNCEQSSIGSSSILYDETHSKKTQLKTKHAYVDLRSRSKHIQSCLGRYNDYCSTLNTNTIRNEHQVQPRLLSAPLPNKQSKYKLAKVTPIGDNKKPLVNQTTSYKELYQNKKSVQCTKRITRDTSNSQSYSVLPIKSNLLKSGQSCLHLCSNEDLSDSKVGKQHLNTIVKKNDHKSKQIENLSKHGSHVYEYNSSDKKAVAKLRDASKYLINQPQALKNYSSVQILGSKTDPYVLTCSQLIEPVRRASVDQMRKTYKNMPRMRSSSTVYSSQPHAKTQLNPNLSIHQIQRRSPF